MPLYTYRCDCGAETDAFNKVADRRTLAPHCACGEAMDIKLVPNLGYVQRECHYVCPVTGQNVTSNRQRQRIMDANGLVSANDIKPKEYIAKAEAEKARNARLAATAHHPLPDREMQKLVPSI